MPARRPLAIALVTLAGLAASLAAAATVEPAWYRVRPGDNLTLIARDFGTTLDRIRRDNGLRGDTIQPGQRIELTEPLAGLDPPRWQPPYRGRARVLSEFGPYEEDRIILPRTGVAVAREIGSEVLAPAVGVIRFLAPMEDLGTVVILEHAAGRHTVLRPLDLSGVDWQVGQCVRQGDLLGRVTAPPEGPLEPYLHIELRRDSKAVPPDPLLR